MIKELNVNDFTVVESIIAKLHKLHVENRPDFYIENEHPINKKEYKAMLNNQNKINIAYIIDDKNNVQESHGKNDIAKKLVRKMFNDEKL